VDIIECNIYGTIVAKGVIIGKEAMVADVKTAISWPMTTKHALMHFDEQGIMNASFSLKP